MALLCLLGSRAVDLLGVTTTFGAASVDIVHRETRRLLEVLGREEVPVLRGSPWPGYRSTEAAHFLAKSARGRPGAITIVATGPLSNLLAAAEVSRGFFAEVGRVVLAGGIVRGVRWGVGRLRERNLSADPAAALAVLGSRRPVTVLSGELCMDGAFRRRDFAGARQWPQWARYALRSRMRAALWTKGSTRLPLWEVLPPAYVAKPDLFEDRTRYCVSTAQDLAAGRLVLAERAVGVAVNVPLRLRSADLLRAQVVSALGTGGARSAQGQRAGV